LLNRIQILKGLQTSALTLLKPPLINFQPFFHIDHLLSPSLTNPLDLQPRILNLAVHLLLQIDLLFQGLQLEKKIRVFSGKGSEAGLV
jgi:hypothetical protein